MKKDTRINARKKTFPIMRCHIKNIFEAYTWLTKKIQEMSKEKKIKNYNLQQYLVVYEQ